MSLDEHEGAVLWVTGLAGAGKTTIARALHARLRLLRGPGVVLLDGDMLREAFGNDLGFSLADRRKVADRNARLSALLATQGVVVVIATISMFHEIHAWNRAHAPNYREIYLEVPLDVLKQRDQKGLYSKVAVGQTDSVLGMDMAPELPVAPDLRITNDGSQSPDAIVDTILASLTLPNVGRPARPSKG